MAEESKIEWTKSTFNPWIGCTRVSPGCDSCYAAVSTPARAMKIEWGPGKPRHRTSESTWAQVRRWNAKAAKTGEFWPVFCASLADIFDNEVPNEWRRDFWALVRECPHLTFQVLTKRIGNVPTRVPTDWGDGYPNVWLGITVVNQEEADRDIPKLLMMPAKKRWLSMEPLLGPVNLRCIGWAGSERGFLDATDGTTTYNAAPSSDRWSPNLPALDWVVVGGESGNNARPMHPEWARSLRDQCAAAGVPFLFKQWGEWLPGHHYTPELQERDSDLAQSRYPCAQFDGKNWDIGYRFSFEVEDDGALWRVGKKAAGRLLDGRTWDEYPEVVR
jgi:protein gp37